MSHTIPTPIGIYFLGPISSPPQFDNKSLNPYPPHTLKKFMTPSPPTPIMWGWYPYRGGVGWGNWGFIYPNIPGKNRVLMCGGTVDVWRTTYVKSVSTVLSVRLHSTSVRLHRGFIVRTPIQPHPNWNIFFGPHPFPNPSFFENCWPLSTPSQFIIKSMNPYPPHPILPKNF